MNTASAEQVTFAHDALSAAEQGKNTRNWAAVLLAPSYDLCAGQFATLAQLWESEGWSNDALRVFKSFVGNCSSLAGSEIWLENDLAVRYQQIRDELTMAGMNPDGSAIQAAEDTATTFVRTVVNDVQSGLAYVTKGVSNLIPWYVWILIAAIGLAYIFSWLPRAPKRLSA